MDVLAAGLSPHQMQSLGFFGMLVLSLAFHEFGHAWTALKLGDDTSSRLGRVTLNPWPHLDPVFSIALPLVLLLSNAGFLLGAGKPVPVNPGNLRRPNLDLLLISVAGPLMNVFLAVLLAGVYHLVLATTSVTAVSPFGNLLFKGIGLNLLLAVFNMIPVPPFDGHRVLGCLLPAPVRAVFYRSHWLGLAVIVLLLFGGGSQYLGQWVLRPLGLLFAPLMPEELSPFGGQF